MSVSPATDQDPAIVDVTMVIQRFRPLFSGQGVQVEVLCGELASRGVHATVLTAGRGRLEPDEKIDGYRVRRLRSDIPMVSRWLRPRRFRGEIFGLRTLAWLPWGSRRSQLVHVHALTDALYSAWLYSRVRRIPIVFEMTLLGTDDPRSLLGSGKRMSRMRNAILRRCDGYVAISPALARAYKDAGFPTEKLRLIPQGVDTRRFSPVDDSTSLRGELGLPPCCPIVVFVGSLVRRKGIDVLLDAWRIIHDKAPDTRLLLVGRDDPGDAESRSLLEERLTAMSRPAREKVHMVGVRDDVDKLLQAADLFVFPSRREGFGTVMIEAMACGLPCVVADLPDITDFIFDSDPPCGVIVPQDAPERLAAEVTGILADAERAAALGSAARRRAVARFSVERIADDYLELYASLTRTNGAR